MPKSKLENLVPLAVLRLRWTGQLKEKNCTHLDQVKYTTPETHVCQECVALGDTWPHLRMCMICGYVGCCDESKNKHMHKHWLATQHPLIRSIEPRENWMWCNVDEALLRVPEER